MAEEVHVDRRRDALADDVDLLARLLGRDHRARQRAERPALRRRDHELGVHDAGHRRQHDRKFGLEEVDDPAVWPHGSARLNELGWVAVQAAKELRRPLNIWSASVTILSTISAAGGISWISPADFTGKDGGDIEIAGRFRRGIFRCDLVRTLHQLDLAARPAPHMVVDQRARGEWRRPQQLLRDQSNTTPRTVSPLLAARINCFASSAPSASMLA